MRAPNPAAADQLAARTPTPRLPRPKRFDQNARVNFREKIVPWDNSPEWRAALRAGSKRLVVTNGCFDLLHLGHVTYLETRAEPRRCAPGRR